MNGTRIRLRVRTTSREPSFPPGDDEFGEALWRLLEGHLDTGVPRPAAMLARGEVVHFVDLAPLVAEPRHAHRMVAGLTAVEGVEALAVVGGFYRRRRNGPTERYAVVFVEWADGRWWLMQEPLDGEGRRRTGGEPEVQRAVDGLPRPGGLGGWFSRARFEEIKTTFESNELVN